MVCQTVKAGLDCAFMTPKGCSFNGGSCHQVVEQCEGCQRIIELPTGRYCSSYPDPASKWKTGPCNFATHLRSGTDRRQIKINPLKASKRNTRKR